MTDEKRADQEPSAPDEPCADDVAGHTSSGAGAGRVTFNPFSITRMIDVASPLLFPEASAAPTNLTHY